ncbi:MAG: glutamine transporter permease [Acidimicrobiales bacterium]|nr:glutamine transporter permease [Acidimicrobiales bacterium]
MLAITLHDLRYRYRQFLIAVVGAGLVFSMALLLTGLSNSFRAEVRRTVDAVGADAWVVPKGSTGPFTAFGALAQSDLESVRSSPGVRAADPLVVIPSTAVIGSGTRTLRVFGHRLGGLGSPRIVDGRAAAREGEVVTDKRLKLHVGDKLRLSGSELTVVGRTQGMSLLGGVPNAYMSFRDAQAIAFHGQPLLTAIVTRGVPTGATGSFTVLSAAQVVKDTVHAMRDAISSIDNSRTLMWIVAAIIVAALVYVSALERVRDFAVLKSIGCSSMKLFLGVAAQAVLVTLLAAVFAVAASTFMRPMFALPVSIPASSYVVLPIVAVVVGVLSSLVALRRAVGVDPTAAFAGAT